MADNPLVEKALEQAAFHEAEALRLKRFVNEADIIEGREPRFGDLAQPAAALVGQRGGTKRWQPGELLGKPFSTAVRMVLEGRVGPSGTPAPASVDEIHEALSQGTYDFGTAGTEAQKQSIRISLGKNTAAFIRLPNTDLFGLVEWYPGLKKTGGIRRRFTGEREPTTSTSSDAGDEEAVEGSTAPEDLLK